MDEKQPFIPRDGPGGVDPPTYYLDPDSDSCASAGCCYDRRCSLLQLEGTVRTKLGFLIAGAVLNWFVAWTAIWALFGYASTLVSLICASIVICNIGYPGDTQADGLVVALLIAGAITIVAAFLALIMLAVSITATVACGINQANCSYNYYNTNTGQSTWESALSALIAYTILVGIATTCYFCNGILSVDGGLQYRRLVNRRRLQQQQFQQPMPAAFGAPVPPPTTNTTVATPAVAGKELAGV